MFAAIVTPDANPGRFAKFWSRIRLIQVFAVAGLIIGGVVWYIPASSLPERVYAETYLREAGVSPDRPYELFSVKSQRGQYGSVSGRVRESFFFGISGEMQGESRPANSLSFAVRIRDQVNIIEAPHSQINYHLDPSAHTPRVQFSFANTMLYKHKPGDPLWQCFNHAGNNYCRTGKPKRDTINLLKGRSTGWLIEHWLRRADIWVTPEVFSRDISPMLETAVR